jgi:hypothetical protein
VTEGQDVAPGDGRDETENERSDRNWTELLQEFRVVQTGTQILAGFLLTLPFQQRFTTLDTFDRAVFVVAVFLAATVTVLAIGPVAVHRLLFRQRVKHALVRASHRILLGCLALASLLFTAVSLLVLDLVLGRVFAIVGASLVLAVALALWTVVPAALRERRAR